MAKYCHWQTITHMNLGDRFIRVDRCPQLGFCRRTITLRQGYRVEEEIFFFDGETSEDDPIYTFKEILAEVEYRQAVCQGVRGEAGE